MAAILSRLGIAVCWVTDASVFVFAAFFRDVLAAEGDGYDDTISYIALAAGVVIAGRLIRFILSGISPTTMPWGKDR